MNIEKASSDFGTMDETVEVAIITDQQNKEDINNIQEIQNKQIMKIL